MDATAPPDEQDMAAQTDSTRSPAQLFRYSTWLHVGEGAEDCPGRETTCEDPSHFHAWCRLPNQFQHTDIRDKALADKARTIRSLRFPESDRHLILESDLEQQARNDAESLKEEVVAKDWWKRQLQASAEVEERDEFKYIERDRERQLELDRMDPDARPAEEAAELERTFQAYADALRVRIEELERPVRDAADGMETDELVEAVREQRIERMGDNAFMETYARWQWFAGTYRNADPVSRKHVFGSMEHLMDAAPEVIEALRDTFSELERTMQRGPRGN